MAKLAGPAEGERMNRERAERRSKQVARVTKQIEYQRARVDDLADRLEAERQILATLHTERARMSEAFDVEIYGGPRPTIPAPPGRWLP